MRILFLSRWYPYPPDNGSKLRVFNLLRGLALQHEVTLLTFTNDSEADNTPPELRSLCRQVQAFPWRPYNPRSVRAFMGLFTLAPRAIRDTFSPQFAQAVREILADKSYDVIIASQIETAAYSSYFQGLPALFEEVELGVPYEKFTHAVTAWQRARSGLTWSKHRNYLMRLLRDFKACTVVSEREKRLFLDTLPGDRMVEVISNCVNLSEYQAVRERSYPDSLIFCGSFRFLPNYDAMLWFIREVYPIIQSQVPAVRLTITGDPGDKKLPVTRNLTQTGFVKDIRPLIARSWVSLAPIFQGGGTRLKILESMALDTPVVATTKGAEGLDVQNGANILIADSPEDFAGAVIRLLRDDTLHQRLVENGLKLVAEKYDWSKVMPHFLELVEWVVQA